ncbi:hypothetical protein ACFOOK_10385 [Micromonospora krabiensis]|nr:hypothetical protein [Micromonospora krabiensis]
MAFRTWGRLLLTALGVSVLAGAGQLGIAYGFGIVRLTGAFTGATVNQWPAQLVWVGWFAANAAVAGAVLTGRLARRDALPATTGRHLAVGAAAALGATAVAPLCMQPARAAELVSVDPVFAVGICAVLGAIVGAGAAIAVLLNPPLGWNVAAVAGAIWLLALVSALPSVGAAGPLRAVRLGVLEPTWLASDAAQRLSLLLLPTIGLLAGAASAALARWRGHVPLVSGATGVAGPVLVAFAYLTAGPGDAVNRYQTTPYYAALIAVAAGALGAAAATLLRWPLHTLATGSTGAPAIEPSAILRPLPAGPALPSGSAAPARPSGRAPTADDVPLPGRVPTGGPAHDDHSTSSRTPDPVAGDPASDGSAVRNAPAHWDWPASGGAPLTVESTLGSAIPSARDAQSAPTGDRPPTTGAAPATPTSATSAPTSTHLDAAGPGDAPALARSDRSVAGPERAPEDSDSTERDGAASAPSTGSDAGLGPAAVSVSGVSATGAPAEPADTEIGMSAMTERHNHAAQSSSSTPSALPDETGREQGRRTEDGGHGGRVAPSPAATAGQAAEKTSAAPAAGDGAPAESTAGPAEPQEGTAADPSATPKPRRPRKARASAKPTVAPRAASDDTAPAPSAAATAGSATGTDRASDDSGSTEVGSDTPSAGPVPPAWPVPPRSTPTSHGPVGTGRVAEAAARDDRSGPAARNPVADQAGPTAPDVEPLPRARHRAPLPDLNRATDWEALATARRAGPASTTPRHTTPRQTTPPPAAPADAAPTDAAPTDAAPTDASSATNADAPEADATATASPPETAAEQSAGRGRGRLGLFRRNRARSDGESSPAEPEPLAEQDEEYVDWVAGLSRPLADNEPEQESGRRSLRSTGRHHRD